MKIALKIAVPAVMLFLSGCTSMNDENVGQHQANAGPYEDTHRSTQRVSHTVEFENDSAELPFNAAEVVEPHARYLIANPDIRVGIQGNASESGTEQYNYNLAMGRAKAVKKLFLELGVDESQLVTLSVGETRSKTTPNRSVVLAY
ncbi:OmpA family protein [Alteromonas gilva]|uniref:OmpA family protein n=1 Tax=Alteromonas gilva TaxID=2987522 RepID=A0ABT5L9Q8_9ALTE|nr:OmpA family protein [Alteromonas gilva]MDC8832882.1 OmpA family protein [Alteromonas gilva]